MAERNQLFRPTPIAIVGIGCRFPGGISDADSLWQFLVEGRSALTEVPGDRWNADRYFHPDPASIGRMVTRRGGFVDRPRAFDASFWGISPREAARMDPQQRWLLEVAWETIEDSGSAPSRLRGANVGVFVGVSSHDYGTLQLDDIDHVDVHTNAGGTLSITANRISYLFDFKGPSIAVDTACSSALVAVSAAHRAICSGECESALAGGVNALFTPNSSIGFSKASMLSPHGECYAFDERANGYVRGEGAGLVMLKPLARAVEEGDPIYAVIRSSVVNQDGTTSSMTVPGLEGQTDMLRRAYQQAGIAPEQVDYVESHGTGTPVGDPIEASALGGVLSAGRAADRPCLIGSIKTNIGHLESASGVAGLIKAAMVVERQTVPPNRNYQTPNPTIPFDQLKLQVADELHTLRRDSERPLVAGINSFGFGGTNAHVVIESAPAVRREQSSPNLATRPVLLPISAKDDWSLREYAKKYCQSLETVDEALSDFCYSAGARKHHHDRRLVVFGDDAAQLRRRLTSWLHDQEPAEGIVVGQATPAVDRSVFVFTGQGSQWNGMGRNLIAREPIVRETMAEIDRHFEPLSGWSLTREMMHRNGASSIDRTCVAQPAIFALQVALVRLWKSWGIEPAVAVGHSVGEVAAAWCAGIYSLADAVRLVYHRSRLQDTTGGKGRMFAAGVTFEEAQAAIGEFRDRVQVTAVNSAAMVTLGGDTRPLEQVADRLQRQDRFVRWLKLDYAFHTHQMEPLRDELLDAVSDLKPRNSQIAFYSTVTGSPLVAEQLGPEYWWRNVRQPVLFERAISNLIDQGERQFLEVGPHPSMRSSINATLGSKGVTGNVFHSLVRESDESIELANNIVGLHLAGAAIDWQSVNQSRGQFVRQPSYPWNHKDHWLDSGKMAMRTDAPLHPLLGERIKSAHPTWQFKLDAHRLTYLKDHLIWDGMVFPASGYVEIGFAVGREMFPGQNYSVEDVAFDNALFTSEESTPTVQIVFDEENRSFKVYSSIDAEHWEFNGGGRLVVGAAGDEPEPLSLREVRDQYTHLTSHDSLYHTLRSVGYGFGDDFSLIGCLRTEPSAENEVDPPRGRTALAEIEVPGSLMRSARAYRLHPAVLDACFQATHGTRDLDADRADRSHFYLPKSIGRIRLFRDEIPRRLNARAHQRSREGDCIVCDIDVCDDQGRAVVEIRRFRVRRVEHQQANGDINDYLYQFHWEPRRLRGTRVERTCRFPSSNELVRSVESELPSAWDDHRLGTFHQQILPSMERIILQAISNAWLDLGWSYGIGDTFATQEFIDQHSIVSDHRDLVRSQLHWMSVDGVLEAEDDRWRVRRGLERADIDRSLRELGESQPRFAPDVALVRATATELSGVMSGRVDPLELFFPGGSNELLERYYTQGFDFPAYRDLIQSTISKAIEALPPRRFIRVLEVGGGTGSLTRAVLESLPADRTEYLFTDIGPGFVASAKERFADFPFVEFRTLDIERDPAKQSVPGDSYDLIVATNVLHATADIRQSLGHIRSSLAPGGMFLCLEVVHRTPLTDNVFGLLRGWWRFRDHDLRPESPLLDRRQWESVLSQSGFDDVRSFTAATDPTQAEQAVFLSQVSSGGAGPGDSNGQAEITTDPPARQRDDRIDAQPTLLFVDDSGVGDALAERFHQRGTVTIRLRRGSVFAQLSATEFTLRDGSIEEFRRVFALARLGKRGVSSIVHCWSLDDLAGADGGAPNVEQLVAAQRYGALTGLNLARTLTEAALPEPPRVFFVTRDSQAVVGHDTVAGLMAAPLTGFSRVANNELHQFQWTTIDLDSSRHESELEDLFNELTISDDELEIAYRDDRRYVNRLRRTTKEEIPQRRQDARQLDGSIVPFRLQMSQTGVLDDLSLNEMVRTAPSDDDVEVRVAAGGINFRDVMKSLGVYPGAEHELRCFGDDFSGVVQRVGRNVTEFRPGDRVAGIASYAFRSHINVDRRMVIRQPSGLSFEQSATVPTAFLTAHLAIHQLARMQPGEKLLIHAAAGGVGLAAIQIAQAHNLEIFATAGTDQKRELLTELGVQHVFNSRTFEFADQIQSITGGSGVDGVLNSLAGEFIAKSLSTLAPLGRFVEIGKADVYNNAKLGMASFKNNISYHMFDLAQLIELQPAMVVDALQQIAEQFEAGVFKPLMHRVFPISEAASAFRYMAQGQHIGKNVLSFEVGRVSDASGVDPNASQPIELAPIPIGPCTEEGRLFEPDATYLVTGGAAGFGFEIVKWMAHQGARRMAVLSRSGPSEPTESEIRTLRESGVEIVDLRGDVTCRADVAASIERLQDDGRPLRGVIHAAMVLDDDFLTELDAERFHRALDPKMLGAWNLHESTRHLELDHFVCFSSFSAVIGAPRQAGYNAGNCFLDALAQHRRSLGLPALTLNWGALQGAGFVHRNQKTAAYLEGMGLKPFDLPQALELFREMIVRDANLIAAARVDWKQLPKLGHAIANSHTYASLSRERAGSASSGSLRSQIAAADVDQRASVVERFLIGQVAGVFGVEFAEIDPTKPLTAFGLDSLMAVELLNRIESESATSVPMGSILSGPSIRELAATVLDLMIDAEDESSDSSVVPSVTVSVDSSPANRETPDPVAATKFANDARLADDIRPPSSTPSSQRSIALLTGATGFLGAWLLRELLETTTLDLVCLVRSDTPQHGMQRIVDNLESYGLATSGLESRVEVLSGELSKPRFGLTDERFQSLASQVDVIYHNGADVNLLLPYESLRSTNVGGTREALRLACEQKSKHLHYVSTFTVQSSDSSNGRIVYESDPLPDCSQLRFGYSQTKWVAEQLVEQARQRGLPVTIYRPGHITGDSQTGAANVSDLLHTIVLACLRLGAAPFRDLQLDVTPVDYVARALTHLSQADDARSQTYHLTNPKPLTTDALSRWMRASGAEVELVPYEQWRQRLMKLCQEGDEAIERFRFLADVLLPSSDDEDSASLHPRFDCSATLQALAGSGIACPPGDEGLLAIGHRYLRRKGMISDVGSVSTAR